MASKQLKPNPIVLGPKISMFDKRGQNNLVKANVGPKIQVNNNKVNIPQFRINQHKGA